MRDNQWYFSVLFWLRLKFSVIYIIQWNVFFLNLFSHDESKQAHEAVYGGNAQHHSSWTHELIGGAAGFAGND